MLMKHSNLENDSVAHLVEHPFMIAVVLGSIPSGAIFFFFIFSYRQTFSICEKVKKLEKDDQKKDQLE